MDRIIVGTPAVIHKSDRRLATALLGAGLTIAAPFLWVASLDSPILRSTGLLMWVAMALGTTLGVVAARRDRRRRVRALAAFSVVCVLLAVPAFLWLTRLPAASDVVQNADFTSLSLPNHRGQLVRLASLASERGALLVFFRGHW